MARRFAKVSEEEIEANNEAAFPYPSAVEIYLNASRLGIHPPLFTSPSGDSCILLCKLTDSFGHLKVILVIGFSLQVSNEFVAL